ncbi:DgyrCDS11456 [Dimorphilus gyrociliatus]|uniref:DgyrCDS11456 n=1 Tax=Dimorphilus gyrociliatus TaxID=2664684 RepID=A0A7I8W3E1_9ANNE|nr:DgyrCDS11456 [Dimorphilus gyrociliatus]
MDMSRGESISTRVSSICKNKEICYDINDKNGIECFQCNSTVEHLTDLEPRLRTCWISDILPKLGPKRVQLIFSFGKTIEVTYIKINFCQNAQPDSMVIKKSVDGKRWVPFQYYSSDCRRNYKVEEGGKVTRDNEVQALCHRILPNEDSISFSPLKFRPSSQQSDESPSLNDWITVSNLQIDLDNPKVGFNHYSISDIKIVGRCKCNGHASRCIQDKNGRLRCDCKHFTAGRDCEKCKTGYHDRPWARGTRDNPNACVACNCNQHSNQCRFNPKLYALSNQESGGYCTNCQHNTIGNRCEVCKEGFYRNPRRKIIHRDACIGTKDKERGVEGVNNSGGSNGGCGGAGGDVDQNTTADNHLFLVCHK